MVLIKHKLKYVLEYKNVFVQSINLIFIYRIWILSSIVKTIFADFQDTVLFLVIFSSFMEHHGIIRKDYSAYLPTAPGCKIFKSPLMALIRPF